jgi:hypothetical protein
MSNRNALLALGLCVLAAGGCSFGDAPKGLSPEETRAAVSKLPAKDQIDYINRSPLPPDEKAKRIADIKASHGLN